MDRPGSADFQQIVTTYADKVYTLAYRITGNSHDAEDVVQETFLRVHKSLDQFRGDSHVYTWIYRIALNTGLRTRRRLDQGAFHSLDEAASTYEGDVPDDVTRWQRDPESRYLYEELIAELQRACLHFVTCSLTDEQRSVYVLRAMLGLSLDDIAEILQVNKNTVKARLHRAKAALKSYFSGRCQWAPESGDCTCESKLGFALTAAPEIIRKLRNHPPDPQTRSAIRTTLHDVTDDETVRRLFPDKSLTAESLSEVLSK